MDSEDARYALTDDARIDALIALEVENSKVARLRLNGMRKTVETIENLIATYEARIEYLRANKMSAVIERSLHLPH